jgi:TPR repeat protein
MPQDFQQAYMWLYIAAERSQGAEHDRTAAMLAAARARLSSDQLAAAERLARNWKPASP